MDEGSGFSPVIRHSYEMAPYQYQPLIPRGRRKRIILALRWLPRDLSADLRGRKKRDHFGPARFVEVLVQGRPNKTMSVYYDEFDIPDHDCIFLNIASALPAVLQVRNLLWSKVGDSS